MRSFSEHIIVTSPLILDEASIKTLTLAGAAAYLLSRSALVKQNLASAKTQKHLEDRLDKMGDAMQAVSDKLTATAAISWSVSKRL